MVVKLIILYAQEKYKRCQLQQKMRKLETQLKKQDNDYTAMVKNYENMYRNCTDEFYKRSYRRNIDMLNSKRELINFVLEFVSQEEKCHMRRIAAKSKAVDK